MLKMHFRLQFLILSAVNSIQSNYSRRRFSISLIMLFTKNQENYLKNRVFGLKCVLRYFQ